MYSTEAAEKLKPWLEGAQVQGDLGNKLIHT